MFKELFKKPTSSILVAAGVVVLAPIVLPPLAKIALHGYFALVDELKGLAADVEKKPMPVLKHLVAAGVEEAATTVGEEAVEETVADAIVEGVVTAMEVV